MITLFTRVSGEPGPGHFDCCSSSDCLEPLGVESLELDGWGVIEGLVQPVVVLCRCSGYADVGRDRLVGAGDRRIEVGIIGRC
jgi:hypothetical protein